MSYSFNVQAPTKGEALLKVAAEFEKVVEIQPEHATDGEQAYSAASGMVDALSDDPTKDVYVSCNGYISWVGTWPNIKVTQSSCTASANLVPR